MITRRMGLGLLGSALVMPAFAAEVLEVGAYPSNPPFEAKDEHGGFDGFEVELARDIAKHLGMTMHITDLGFQALFAATASRRIDLAISTITITPERLKNQAFTQPYMDDDLALIAGASSPLKSLADTRGKTLGSLASSTSDTWLKANGARLGIAGTKSYDTITNLFLDVTNGRVDGGVNDHAGSLYAMKSMRGMRVVEVIPAGEEIAMMLPKGSALLQPVNDAITALKQDGTVAGIYQKWLGAAALAKSSTVEVRPLPEAG